MVKRFKVTDGNTALGVYPTANAAARYMREAIIRRPRHGGEDYSTWPRPCPCGKADCWIYGPPQKCDGCGQHSFRVSMVGTTHAGNVFVCSRACVPSAVRNAHAGR